MLLFNKIVILSFLLFITTVNSQSDSALKFENETCDYGTLKVGDKAECVFNFTNTGLHVIKIENVKSNSRNIELKLSNDSVKPSGKGTLTVTFDCKTEGPIRKTITVFTTSKPKVHTLLVKGRILPKS